MVSPGGSWGREWRRSKCWEASSAWRPWWPLPWGPNRPVAGGDGEPAYRRGSVHRPLAGVRMGDHPSVRPTRECRRAGSPLPVRPCSGWGLPSRPGHPGRWCALTAPFHPHLCPIPRGRAIGGLFSVALSCGSPRLAASQHPALRSPDLPQRGNHAAATRPAHRPDQSGARIPLASHRFCH